MKYNNVIKSIVLCCSTLLLVLIFNCSGDDSSGNIIIPSPQVIVTGNIIDFGEVNVLSHSNAQSFQVKGSVLTADVNISATNNFKISIDNTSFVNQLSISKDDANAGDTMVYVRFSPNASAVGIITGSLTMQSAQATNVVMPLSGTGVSIDPIINVNINNFNFPDTMVTQSSTSQNLVVNGDNLVSDINLQSTEGFEMSLDNTQFFDVLQIPAVTANDITLVYVRFTPTVAGDATGSITLTNADASDVEVALSGHALPAIYNYPGFQNQRIAFGGGFNQTETGFFDLHADNTAIESIMMYVKLRCPTGGCNAWDVYANIKVKDTDSGEWYEIGRYITPYGVDNSQVDRGFEIDVTDFKSLLEGSTELYARIETWGSDGWELSIDFDYVEGTPDFEYYAVSKVFAYDDWSTSGVVYGTDASAFDLTKTVAIPANSESTHLRTIISGWGHATPTDSEGRPCAEWCFRTHDILIDSANMFQHVMGPIGCPSNPVQPQNGNWSPDRAGWCPGMAVPVRIDDFSNSMSGSTFNFEYDYESWTADGGSTSGTPGAYYATSTFVVVKSTTPINKPVVTD